MTNPSDLLGEFQSLTTTPQSVAGGRNVALTTIYAANNNASTPLWLHLLETDGSTRRWSLLVPANYSGIIFTVEGGVRTLNGLKVAGSTAKGSLTGSLGTDLDVCLFGRNA